MPRGRRPSSSAWPSSSPGRATAGSTSPRPSARSGGCTAPPSTTAGALRSSKRRDRPTRGSAAALSSLLARAGHLREADEVATKYCLAAVSVLAEKGNIGLVRKFQKALKEAHTLD